MIIFKKIILNIFIFFILLLCFRNYISTTSQYVLSNISIREAFLYNNEGLFDANNDGELDFVKKGTHEGGEDYFYRINEYLTYLKNFDINQIIKIKERISNIDIKETQFNKEYILINKLIELSKIKRDDRKKIAIYIPKSNRVYWDLSCDSLMIPFIVPAISNITSILSLPTMPWSKSCFGQLDGYGYGIYYKNLNEQIPVNDIDYEDYKLCHEAKKYSIYKIIKLYFIKNDIVAEELNCN